MNKGSKRRPEEDELRPEYDFDFSKSRPNRFAEQFQPGGVGVILDPDVAEVFRTSESVNRLLRSVIAAVREKGRQPAAKKRKAS